MMNPRRLQILRSIAFVTAILSGALPSAHAGEFVISPLRVGLDRAVRSTEIVVRNDDKTPLRMQIEAMSWRQDADGKDQYAPAQGLLFFPRTMEIPAGESRIVRVGIKAAPVSREETYRLFIEELPSPTPSGSEGGASLQVFLRVGVPVFVSPAKADRRMDSERFEFRGRRAEWRIANPGNVHVRGEQVELTGFAADGTLLFTVPSEERYFLAGVVKTLQLEVPREACARLATLEAAIIADNLDLKRKIDVPAGSCQ